MIVKKDDVESLHVRDILHTHIWIPEFLSGVDGLEFQIRRHVLLKAQ